MKKLIQLKVKHLTGVDPNGKIDFKPSANNKHSVIITDWILSGLDISVFLNVFYHGSRVGPWLKEAVNAFLEKRAPKFVGRQL